MPAARGEVCDTYVVFVDEGDAELFASTQVARCRGAKAAGTNDDSIRLADHGRRMLGDRCE